MKDYSNTPHSLVAAFKPKETKPALSPLEQHYKKMRAATEKEIGYLQMAADACMEAGYDISKVDGHKQVWFLQHAVKDVSDMNGSYHGDSYKPFDHDMAFPTKSDLVTYMRNECPKNNVPKIIIPAEPEFKFVII